MSERSVTDQNLAVYDDPTVVAHYLGAHGLMPAERYVAVRYPVAGRDVLDVGVGGGRTVPWLSTGARSYLGIDYAPNMVANCQTRFPDLAFRCADASDLVMLAEDSFDLVVFSFNGIDYLPDDAMRRRALAELRRVTRPTGTIVLSSHNARQLAVLPDFTDADPARIIWRSLVALGKTVRQIARPTFVSNWSRGHGYVLDPVHGGLHTHVSTPASLARDAATAGLRLIETIDAAGRPTRGDSWGSGWLTYVLERGGV